MDKREVLEHLTGAREELLAAIEGLSETEMTTLPVAGVWTIEDILAHISGWTAWDLAGIRTILAGERPDFSAIQDVDTFNGRLVTERSTWSLDQVLAEMEERARCGVAYADIRYQVDEEVRDQAFGEPEG